MSDLIRREDAARIAEDHNLDIWEYSTGNRSRIGHDPVAEAIRALPAIEALTAERDHAWAMVAKADTQMGQSLADHLQAKAERDRLREALEDIADHDTGATAGLAYTAKIALKGENLD